MPHYRLLAIDVDGTLLDRRDQLSVPTRDAVRRAAKSGMRVVLATGRRYGRVLHLVETLRLDVPLITASGALIKNPGNHATIFRADIERELLSGVLTTIVDAGYDPLLCGDTHTAGFEFYYHRDDVDQPELSEFLSINSGLGRCHPELTVDPPDEVFNLFAMGTRDEMLGLEHQLNETFPERLYTHVLRSPLYSGFMCEVAAAGIDKWSGVRHLAAEWGITDDEICAVGDDVNDIPMLRGAGLGVAMQNASDEVKASADRVAPSNDNHGVGTVVEWLLGE